MNDSDTRTTPHRLAQFAGEPDYSDPGGDDFEALARDAVPVRSLRAEDLDAVVTLDRRITGRERGAYYRRKFTEALEESGVRVSLVADDGDQMLGFVMARVDFGEFGRAVTTASIDTIGVDRAARGRHVGAALLSQLLANLASLHVETVQTRIAWDHRELGAFLARCGFHPSQQVALRQPL